MTEPRVAVLSLCRDRLDYTKVCFRALRQNAGIPYGHFVFDQGSTDGTAAWLAGEYDHPAKWIVQWSENIGIHRAMNKLLDIVAQRDYDLLVKVDNDCRVLTPGTLRAVAEHVLEDPRTARVVSPLILGLRHRPGIYDTREYRYIQGDNTQQVRLGMTRALGGIFMPIPPLFVKAGFRYDETAPVWGGDDEKISAMAREQGGYTGYLLDFEAEHYETTNGQVARYPGYFQRRVSEGGPPK